MRRCHLDKFSGRYFYGAACLAVTAGLAGCSGTQPTRGSHANAAHFSRPTVPPPNLTQPFVTLPLTTPVPNPPPSDLTASLDRPAPVPREIRIPQLNIDASITPLPTSASPDLATLLPAARVAYLTGTFTPGTVGVSVLAGHTGSSGVFGRLGEVEVGADIIVTDIEGHDRHFDVLSRAIYAKNTLPEQLWSPTFGRQPILILISCTGPVRSDGLHRDNIVLISKLQ